MSYALGLAGERPKPAGVLAFSGFIPTVDGWQPDLASRHDVPVSSPMAAAIRSSRWGSPAAAGRLLQTGGLPVEYHESDALHHIDPAHIPAAVQWLRAAAENHSATTTTTEGR